MDRRLIRELDILTLQLFVAICEEGKLIHAAHREGIAPSAVSKRLAGLESALGVELFFRRSNGMAPTTAGLTLLHHCRRMLQNVENIGIELKEYSQGIRGYVRVRANISAIVQFLPEDLSAFLASHPEIKIDLVERPSRAIVDEIERGTGDLGICSSRPNTIALPAVPYRSDKLVVALAPGHPLSTRNAVAFRDTLDYDYIGLHADSSIVEHSMTSAGENATPLKLKIHVPGFDALCRMVQANLGIGLSPDRAFDIIGKPLGLQSVALSDEWARRRLSIVHRGTETLSTPALLLLRHLVES